MATTRLTIPIKTFAIVGVSLFAMSILSIFVINPIIYHTGIIPWDIVIAEFVAFAIGGGLSLTALFTYVHSKRKEDPGPT